MNEVDRSDEALALEWRMFFLQNWAGMEFIKWLVAQGDSDVLLRCPDAEIPEKKVQIRAYRSVVENINNTISNLKNRKESKTQNVSAHTGGHTIAPSDDGINITATGSGSGKGINRWRK